MSQKLPVLMSSHCEGSATAAIPCCALKLWLCVLSQIACKVLPDNAGAVSSLANSHSPSPAAEAAPGLTLGSNGSPLRRG